MGLIATILLFFSISNASNNCVNIFSFSKATDKATQSYSNYINQREVISDLHEGKLYKVSQSFKKSQHPYSLLKTGFIQKIYLYLYTKSQADSKEYYDQILNAVKQHQETLENIFQVFLRSEIKKQQLNVLNTHIASKKGLRVQIPTLIDGRKVLLKDKEYPNFKTLKMHYEQLSVEVAHLANKQIREKILDLELKQAEIYMLLAEAQSIVDKHIHVYDSHSQVLSRSHELSNVLNLSINNNEFMPTQKSVQKYYFKMFKDNMGFVFRGHKYSEEVESLNLKLKDILPEDQLTSFKNKSLYESLRIYSNMNFLKRITGRVVDRSYFKNMFRFKFMGASVLFVSLWLTNPIEFMHNYDFAKSLSRLELKFNDSRYVYKMRDLDEQKFTDVASKIYMIMSKDYFKEIDGKIYFIKRPDSGVSPVQTILRALELKNEYIKSQSQHKQKQEIAKYHTIQTIKLDLLTKVAFSDNKKSIIQEVKAFLTNEYSSSLPLSSQVMLTEWLIADRQSKPIVTFEFKPMSADKIINSLEETSNTKFDKNTINEIKKIVNNYSSNKQYDLMSESIWRDLDAIKTIRLNYFSEYKKAQDSKSFRYSLIEDLAYEMTASEFQISPN